MRRLIATAAAGVLMILVFSPSLSAQSSSGPQEIRNSDDAFKAGHLIVSGMGVGGDDVTHAGQRKLMALRAAQVLAYRELLEVIKGLSLAGETSVRNGMSDDTVRTGVEGLVRGAQTIYKHYDPSEDLATVSVRLPLKGRDGLTGTVLPALTMPPPPGSVPYAPPSTPSESAPPADGLIVDVSAHRFRPAFINRILSVRGEILYDPSKVAQAIFVERGSGEYTTDVGKARALLSERGSRNPMTVEAAGVERMTNVQVSPADAAAIFAANQHASFLEAARVVFVVK